MLECRRTEQKHDDLIAILKKKFNIFPLLSELEIIPEQPPSQVISPTLDLS